MNREKLFERRGAISIDQLERTIKNREFLVLSHDKILALVDEIATEIGEGEIDDAKASLLDLVGELEEAAVEMADNARLAKSWAKMAKAVARGL